MTLAIIFESVGVGEWFLLLAVVLIVVGPKRMPEMARKFGQYYSKFRRAADSFKRQLMDMDTEFNRAVDEAAKTIPVVQSGNYSLGINLLLELVRKAAATLGDEYDIEVTEMHHRHKKDAPSGTALMLAKSAAEGRNADFGKVAVFGREGETGERPAGEIAVHALRGGSVVGDHTVMFAGDVERVELTHKAQGREAFAAGALKALEWAAKQPSGIYNMRDVLGFAD
jgi:4-hydroxy-tetrahydrodipicolinate reductase